MNENAIAVIIVSTLCSEWNIDYIQAIEYSQSVIKLYFKFIIIIIKLIPKIIKAGTLTLGFNLIFSLDSFTTLIPSNAFLNCLDVFSFGSDLIILIPKRFKNLKITSITKDIILLRTSKSLP